MKIAARFPVIVAIFVAAFALGDRTANAVSGCGEHTFGNTTVHECYDAADSYVTYSNACGTQRLDVGAANRGAVPNQIVPCPRPNPGGTNPSLGNRQSEDLRSGAQAFREGASYFQAGNFGLATEYYASAESYFRRGGDAANAEHARHNKNLSICHENIGNDNPTVLRLLLGQGEREFEMAGFDIPGEPAPASTQRLGACTTFPPEAQRVRDRIAAIETRQKQAQEAAALAARWRAAEEEQARRRAAAEAARRADGERERQRETEKREAAQQLAQATQEAVANGGAQAAHAQNQFAANDPLNSGTQGFEAASTRAHGQQAVPTANSLRASQGNCSDISGLGGGGPVNCTPSSGTNTQARLNEAQASLQAGQAVRQSDPSSAVGKLLEAARLFQAADQVAEATAAFAEAIALEKKLSCPPAAPKEYWPDAYEKYCTKASTNCVERGSAYYGLVCYAGREREAVQTNTDEASRKICADALTILSPHAPDNTWLADQLAKVKPPCNVNGTPMSLRDRLLWDVKQHVTTQESR